MKIRLKMLLKRNVKNQKRRLKKKLHQLKMLLQRNRQPKRLHQIRLKSKKANIPS